MLAQYDEFLKVEVENGFYQVKTGGWPCGTGLSIGTITSDVSIRVKWLAGGSLGTIEESFISQLKPGDTFWFAGRSLEFIRVKEMTRLCKKIECQKRADSELDGRAYAVVVAAFGRFQG